jgi:hypothetical protein|nr:MAG TPA: hypothetical protein [Caudoviricetes sp.]
MTTQELKNIATQNGLELVKVNNMDDAICGFKSFSQAQEIADKYDLRLLTIKRKGSGNYEYDDCGISDDINVLEQYEQTNCYTIFLKGDEVQFQEIDIDETLEQMKENEASQEEIAEFLEEMNEIKAKIESLTDDQFIALDCANGTYSKILPKMAADYYNSSSDIYYTVAVM